MFNFLFLICILEDFNTARARQIRVSECDLKRWAIAKSKELDLKFKASDYWIHTFKVKNRIVSRKITKYLTRKEMESLQEVETGAKAFVENFKIEVIGIDNDNVLNFDQSGFTYEYAPRRTLSFKGEKDTLGLVVSHNANTHSYTVMPLLSMGGKFIGKLLICLQEPKGKLGPRVSESLEIPENIYLVVSKSGKLDKGLMASWVEECVQPLCKDKKIALMYDSWTGQTDETIYTSIGENCTRLQIPAKATSLIQPLDKYIFRQYKIFRRKIFERVVLDNLDVDLHKRQYVIKMHSVIYNQLQCDDFNAMLRYAWMACNYIEDKEPFLNVNALLFNLENDECECDCDEQSFIRCGHCKMHLCFKHFFEEFHFHPMEELHEGMNEPGNMEIDLFEF